jgi:hypothetical protein
VTFKKFVDKAHRGQLTTSDLEAIAHVRVPSAEGYVRTIGAQEVPSYLSTIRVTDPHHREAVERALSAAL